METTVFIEVETWIGDMENQLKYMKDAVSKCERDECLKLINYIMYDCMYSKDALARSR